MPSTRVQEHQANEVVRDAVELHDELVEMLVKEVGQRVGYEEITKRKIRALARRAKKGDTQAMIAVLYMEANQPDEVSRASLYEEVEHVLNEPGEPQPEAVIQEALEGVI